MSCCGSEFDLPQAICPEASCFDCHTLEADFLINQCDFDSNFQTAQFDSLPVNTIPAIDPYFYSYPNVFPFSLPQESFLQDEFLPQPKRPKLCEEVPCPTEFVQFQMPDCHLPQSREYPPVAAHLLNSYAEAPARRKDENPTASAQSVAARERRRRITEKTQQLGMLIPGGSKMNTAEMLQAAFKYIKFLQSQLTVLELLNSVDQVNHCEQVSQEVTRAETCSRQELADLLSSASVQEKLYTQEKSLGPVSLLVSLMQRNDIAPDSTLSAQLTRLVT